MLNDFVWSVDEVQSYLEAAFSGNWALDLIDQYAIEVYRVPEMRTEYIHRHTGERSESFLYGMTEYAGNHAWISIHANLDAFTAAATIVHEVEHAQWQYTRVGGYEEHARVRDLYFYIEHSKLHLLPEEYFQAPPGGTPVVQDRMSGFDIDWYEVLRRWGRNDSATAVTESVWNQSFLCGEPERIEFIPRSRRR